jgi:hypothetical protein
MGTKIASKFTWAPAERDRQKPSRRLGISEAGSSSTSAQTYRFRATQRDLAAWENERRYIQTLIEEGAALANAPGSVRLSDP